MLSYPGFVAWIPKGPRFDGWSGPLWTTTDPGLIPEDHERASLSADNPRLRPAAG
jgi:hypothetical protein